MKSHCILSVFCLLFSNSLASKSILPNKELKVNITSIPEGSEVLFNAFYVGKTPITLTINTNSRNFIYVSKVGFIGQRITLDSKNSEVNIELIKQ